MSSPQTHLTVLELIWEKIKKEKTLSLKVLFELKVDLSVLWLFGGVIFGPFNFL